MPAQGFDSAPDHLRNAALNSADPANRASEPLAYALFVLARNGRPIIGDLRYHADTKLTAFTTPMAQAQVGGSRDARRPREGGKSFHFGAECAGGVKRQRPVAARLRFAPAPRCSPCSRKPT